MIRFSHDPGPVFGDPGREFHWAEGVLQVRRAASGVDLRVATHGGPALDVRVTFYVPQVVRVQFHASGGPLDRTLPMLARKPQRVPVRVTENHEAVRLRSGDVGVEITRQPWGLRLLDATDRPVFTQLADRSYDHFITCSMGFAVERATGRQHVYDTFLLEHGAQFYGLGERYGALARRGLRTVLWCVDTHGTNSTDLVYKPVPFFMSTAGYGLFIHTTARTTVDLGAYSAVSGWFYVEEPVLDYFLIYGPALKAILNRYVSLTGRVPVPPRWSFGIWLSRCMYRNRRQVEQVVTEARRRRFPFDVVHLDPLWLRGRNSRDYDSSDLQWDEQAFPKPTQFIGWLRRHGVRLSLWENPYFPMSSPLFEEAARQGCFMRTDVGGIARFRGEDAAIVDFTNPQAREWYKSLHRPLLRQGVAVFKTDYGEEMSEDAVTSGGTAGRELHNLYPFLYNRTVFEVTREFQAQPLVWSRSGWAGSQRFPVHWSGDPPSRWEALPPVLASGLSLGLSGFAFWSHDIGGFYGLRDSKLYIRWAQLGLMSSHARFHGKEPREPWRYGPRAFAIVQRYAQLRYRLLPYLYSEAIAAARAGVPLMRALVLEYQDDPTVWAIYDQYLLGSILMVAPVLTERDERRVYLPAGKWWDFHTQTRHEGPRWLHLRVPLDTIPIFVRADTVLPLGPPVQHSGERSDPLTFEVRVDAKAVYGFDTEAGRVVVRAKTHRDGVVFAARGGRGTHIIRVLGLRRAQAAVRGRARVRHMREGEGMTEITVAASGAYRLVLHRK